MSAHTYSSRMELTQGWNSTEHWQLDDSLWTMADCKGKEVSGQTTVAVHKANKRSNTEVALCIKKYSHFLMRKVLYSSIYSLILSFLQRMTFFSIHIESASLLVIIAYPFLLSGAGKRALQKTIWSVTL